MSSSSESEDLESGLVDGRLQPGLNIPVKATKVFINNKAGLAQKLVQFQQENLAWIETVALTNGVAPMGPELAQDLATHDLKREGMFYRQAQAAVLEALPRLHKLGVKTRRPDDYFAQMAKSDDHMQRIRRNLVRRQKVRERSEKLRQLRAQKKHAKQIQIQTKLDRVKEKRSVLDEIKKMRNQKGGREQKSDNKKRLKRNERYGMGGKKRNLKRNNKESSADFSTSRNRQGNKTNKRLGKSRRIKVSSKKRR